MEQSSQDRNLPASELKLKKAREDGQVARSRDLGHLAVLGTGALSLVGLAPFMFDRLKLHFERQLMFDAGALVQPAAMLTRLQDITLAALVGCVIFGLITMAVSTLSTLTTGGWVASLKPVTPDFSRINPLNGLSLMFSKEKLAEVVKMTFIATMLIALGSAYLNSSLHSLALLILQPSSAALQHLANWLIAGMSLLLVVIFLVALVDVPLQNFLHKSRMKMSHQEVRQEHKESDGNPEQKSWRRQRQREISQGNSIGAVPRADFVLMNPTHFAVAIRYDDQTMRAPQVVSKGADLLALKIRDIAKTHSIPVLQSPMLARALYANAELNQDIPASLYTAVAQVLAYIYRLKAALRGDGPMPDEPPLPFVPPELDPLSKVVASESAP